MKRILRAWQETVRSVGEGLGFRSNTLAAGRHHVFIAYSWSDVLLASAVQRGLERLAKPWHRTRALRVFRDSTSLPAGPSLRKALRAALDDSDYLILIASRAAASSEHVHREIEYWQSSRGVDKLLIGVAEGALRWSEEDGDYDEESWAMLPESLRGAFVEEALHVDFTQLGQQQFALEDDEFRDAIRLLAARLHGVQPAELAGREIAERRRTILYARVAGLVLVALTVVALVAGVVALIQRSSAIEQSHLALSRQLAAEAEVVRSTQPDLALLLGAQALETSGTAEARSSLLGSLLAEPWIVRFLYGPPSPVLAMTYVGTGGSELITVHGDGEVLDWSTERGTGRRIARLGPVAEALIAGDTVAVVRSTGRLDVYRVSGANARMALAWQFSASPRSRCRPATTIDSCREGLLTAISELGDSLVTDLEGTHLELWEVERHRLAPGQPPTYLTAPADISFAGERLVAVHHHFTSSSNLSNPAPPADEVLSWPLAGGPVRLLARVQINHTPEYLFGPLVADEALSGTVAAALTPGLVTAELTHSSHPVIAKKLSEDEAPIVGLLDNTPEIIYLDAAGTVGTVVSSIHASTRMVSNVDALVEQSNGAPIQHRLAMAIETGQIAVAGGSRGILLLRPSLAADRPLIGTPIGGSIGEKPTNVASWPPNGLPVFSNDGTVLAGTINVSEGLGLWRTDTGATVALHTGAEGRPYVHIARISISPDDHTVAFITKPAQAVEPLASQAPPVGTTYPGSVRIWDGRSADNPRMLAIPFAHGDGPTACAFVDSRHLVVGTGFGWLYFWDLRTGKQWRAPLRLPLETPTPVMLLGLYESGKLLVGAAAAQLRVLDERTGQVSLALGPEGVVAEALSPSGRLVAGIDTAGDVQIWVPQTGRTVPGSLLAPSYVGAVQRLALGDGLLAVTSLKAVTLYDTSTLREVGQVDITAGAPVVAFSPTRQAVAVVNTSEAAVLAIDPNSLISRACTVANRELTRAEWDQFIGSAMPYSVTCHLGARR